MTPALPSTANNVGAMPRPSCASDNQAEAIDFACALEAAAPSPADPFASTARMAIGRCEDQGAAEPAGPALAADASDSREAPPYDGAPVCDLVLASLIAAIQPARAPWQPIAVRETGQKSIELPLNATGSPPGPALSPTVAQLLAARHQAAMKFGMQTAVPLGDADHESSKGDFLAGAGLNGAYASGNGPASIAPSADPARPNAVPVSQHPSFETRQLNLARDMTWIEDLAKDIVAARHLEDRLSFRLLPRELGQIDVNLSTSTNGLSVRMSTTTDEARTLLATQQPRLLDELRGHGVRVAEAEVLTGERDQSSRNWRASLPFIETAIADEPVRETPSNSRPRGRFA